MSTIRLDNILNDKYNYYQVVKLNEYMCFRGRKEVLIVSEPTKTLTIRVSPEEHKEIRVYIASKGLTAQEYIKGLIENDMKNATKEKEVYVGNE